MKQPNKSLLFVLFVGALWFGCQAQAGTLEGVIWGVDLENNKISIDGNGFSLSPKVKIYNLAGGSSNPKDLSLKQHVRVTTNESGTVIDIWIFPSDRKKRWNLGYGLEERRH